MSAARAGAQRHRRLLRSTIIRFLEPVLRETLGVILYQEQVLGVSMALAGFSAGQADQLRRAMTRKRSREAMVRLWDAVHRQAP